jgi:hypothetical protein
MVAGSPTPQAQGDPSRVAMRVVNIDTIVQLEGSFELDPEQMPEAGSAMRPIHDGGKSEVEQQGGRVAVSIEYAFAAVVAPGEGMEESEPQDVKPFFVCRARFVVAYQLDSDDAAKEADLRAFADVNGRLNTVPFWREFLHNALARAGLPTYEVPPFNPARLARDFEPSPDQDGSD